MLQAQQMEAFQQQAMMSAGLMMPSGMHPSQFSHQMHPGTIPAQSQNPRFYHKLIIFFKSHYFI
jgi:hypothetical protein